MLVGHRGVLRHQAAFSLEDLVEALNRTGPSGLLDAIHMALLKLVLHSRPLLMRNLSPATWQPILRKWAKKQDNLLPPHLAAPLKDSLHHSLSPVDKIALLSHVCHAALDAPAIR